MMSQCHYPLPVIAEHAAAVNVRRQLLTSQPGLGLLIACPQFTRAWRTKGMTVSERFNFSCQCSKNHLRLRRVSCGMDGIQVNFLIRIWSRSLICISLYDNAMKCDVFLSFLYSYCNYCKILSVYWEVSISYWRLRNQETACITVGMNKFLWFVQI